MAYKKQKLHRRVDTILQLSREKREVKLEYIGGSKLSKSSLESEINSTTTEPLTLVSSKVSIGTSNATAKARGYLEHECHGLNTCRKEECLRPVCLECCVNPGCNDAQFMHAVCAAGSSELSDRQLISQSSVVSHEVISTTHISRTSEPEVDAPESIQCSDSISDDAYVDALESIPCSDSISVDANVDAYDDNNNSVVEVNNDLFEDPLYSLLASTSDSRLISNVSSQVLVEELVQEIVELAIKTKSRDPKKLPDNLANCSSGPELINENQEFTAVGIYEGSINNVYFIGQPKNHPWVKDSQIIYVVNPTLPSLCFKIQSECPMQYIHDFTLSHWQKITGHRLTESIMLCRTNTKNSNCRKVEGKEAVSMFTDRSTVLLLELPVPPELQNHSGWLWSCSTCFHGNSYRQNLLL